MSSGPRAPAPGAAGSPWTGEQRVAIERRSGELLLDAGAGSGKTSVLVERFVRDVLEDGIEVGAILAITFTEKAAAELRDRIRAGLRARGADAAAQATEGAFISTIHGFCARVLRGGALAAGLDPGFVVLDRDASEPLAEAAMDAALNEFAALGEPAVALVADLGAGPLRSAIRAVYAELRSRGQRLPRLPPIGPLPGPEAGHELAAAARVLIEHLSAVPDPGVRVGEALERAAESLQLAGGEDPWPARLPRLRLPGNGAALSGDACEAYTAALEAYRVACAARAAAPVRDRLDALLAGFGRHYEAAKRERSAVDFEDLELIARDLLADDAETRSRYRERFARIMVDELQDTNRVQLELIEALGGGNIFTVGDAQQSIYRFRHAEVELFERRGERLAASGRRATLQTNFRSRPEILAVLNSAFAEAFGARFRPLAPGRPPAPAAGDSGVELLLVDKGAQWELEGLAAPWRIAESRALAARIGELVAAGTPPGEIVVLLRAGTDMRAYERALEEAGLPTYVIGGRGYWSHPQVVDLLAYLAVLANPLDEEPLFGVLASPLVGVSLDALVILAGIAREQGRGPWAVLTDPDPAVLAPLPAAEREPLRRFAGWAAEERGAATRLGVAALIERALRTSDYDLTMLAMPGGRRRLANVRKLMRLAVEHEAAHGPGLRSFLGAVRDRAAGRGAIAHEGEAPVEGEGLDAVRLMTIHRAKGLEFPTVCVADLGRSARPGFEIIRVGSDGRLGLRLSRAGTGGRVSALAFDEIGRELKAAEEAEERRLFYVAMTRARERLILSGATRFEGWTAGGAKGGGPIVWIAPAFVPDFAAHLGEDARAAPVSGGVTVRIATPESLIAAAPPSTPGGPATGGPGSDPGGGAPVALRSRAPAPAGRPPPAAPAALPRPPVRTLSYSALGAYARCGYRFYTEQVLGLPAAAEASGASRRGVLVHALLERLSFRRPLVPEPEAVSARAAELGLEPAPTRQEAEEIVALLRGFAASELCARLARAAGARREERFAFALADGTLLTGAIDALAREPGDRTLIVDYKTDRLGSASPAARVTGAYAVQRLIYALAGLHAGARVVEVAYCFLERPEQPVIARYDQAGRGELTAELERLTAGVLERRFPVSATPHLGLCAGCPAEGGLCSWPLAMTRRGLTESLF